MAKPCQWCGKKPKRRLPRTDGKPGFRVDNWCSAKCKRANTNDYYKVVDRSRPCDPDHGFF